MRDTEDTVPAAEPESLTEGLRESVPLLITSLVLFVAGYLAATSGAVMGSSRIPLYLPLVLLGFVAAIGSVLSWFFAGRTYRRKTEVEVQGNRSLTHRVDAEDGRPRPTVRRETLPEPQPAEPEPAPWDEGPASSLLLPSSRLSSRSLPLDAGEAIRELEGIQRDMVSRRERLPRTQS